MKSAGVYSNLLTSIRSAKANGDTVLDFKEIRDAAMKEADPEDFDKDELLEAYVTAMTYVVLNQENCYSLFRGLGIFVNLDACENADDLKQLLSNKNGDIKSDAHTFDKILYHLRAHENQFQMDLDNDPTRYFISESIEEILERVMNE